MKTKYFLLIDDFDYKIEKIIFFKKEYYKNDIEKYIKKCKKMSEKEDISIFEVIENTIYNNFEIEKIERYEDIFKIYV